MAKAPYNPDSFNVSTMKQVIEEILKSRNLLESFKNLHAFHIRIENSPYMDLCIERTGRWVCVTHYFEQNGDLVPNPDMEFEILENGSWRPVAIQHPNGIYKVAVRYENENAIVNQQELAAQESFARMWANNLLEQGFVLKT